MSLTANPRAVPAPSFTQTQELSQVWSTAIALAIAVPLIVLVRQGNWDAIAIAVLVLGFAAAMSWAMFHFTVTVTRDAVTWGFRNGWFAGRTALADIVSVRPDILGFWWGYGVKWTPNGRLYRAAGRKVVRVDKINGRTFFLGSDNPQALVAAIEAARQSARPDN